MKETANYRAAGSVIVNRSPVDQRKPYHLKKTLNKNISTLKKIIKESDKIMPIK